MATGRRMGLRIVTMTLLLVLALPAPLVTLSAMATSAAGCSRGWRLVRSPASMEILESISMTGPYDGWAVGLTKVDQVLRTRAVRISDGVWSVVPTPNVEVGDSLIHNQLHGVAAVGTIAFAIGERRNHRGEAKPIAMRWTGTEWLVTRVPRPGKTARTRLVDVAAISPADAWAVGAFYDPARGDDPFGSFALHWDGTSWSRFTLPNPVRYSGLRIAGVGASGPGNVWAVGQVFDPERVIDRPAVFRWNGRTWNWVPSPRATKSSVELGSVAVSGRDVWVVGTRRGDGVSATRPFSMHHDGTSWHVSGIPPSSEQWHWLTGVAIAGDSRVWAAGTFRRGDPDIDVDQLPVLERWNGTRWSSAPLPLPEPTDTDPSYSLLDVAAYGRDAIAVGPGLAYRLVTCG